ncbi:11147_t:CDS:2, partial [Racocetra persica]
PVGDYELSLTKAEILKTGKDVTFVGYGSQIYILEKAIQMAEKNIPVAESVNKTGRLMISHEVQKYQQV